MINPTQKSSFNWMRGFMVLLLIILLPASSAFAMPPGQDSGPFARRSPDKQISLLDNEVAVADLSAPEMSASAIIAAVPGTNLVADPSFENSVGTDIYWGQGSTNFGSPVCQQSFCNEPGDTVNGPRTGLTWAWFGGADFTDPTTISPEEGVVYQDFGFPSVSCRATLQFYLWIIAAPGSDANDMFVVYIDGNPVFIANATQAGAYPSYQLVSLDVSAFNGGFRRLAFYSIVTGQLVSFHVDDVSLVSTGCTGTVRGDYDGDRIADVGVFRPSNGTWYITTLPSALFWGTNNDIPVPADYNGDGVNEIGVFRPSNSTWYINGLSQSFVWGAPTDIPVVADYDGNGTDDVAVFRPSNGTWYIVGRGAAFVWGAPGDIPVVADYDGNGIDDVAVFRPSNSTWYIVGSSVSFVWGTVGDIPVVADYDGNGMDDVAVFRPSNSTWYIVGRGAAFVWGAPTDIPVPADFDGDGRAEVGVFRPSNGTWYVEGFQSYIWGANNDIPVSSQILMD